MKKQFWIIITIILISGLVLSTIGFAVYGFNWQNVRDDIQTTAAINYESFDVTNQGPINQLVVDVRSRSLVIQHGEAISVSGYLSENQQIDLREENGVMRVSVENIESNWHWNILQTAQFHTIIITIPYNASLDLNLITRSGSIQINNLTVNGNVTTNSNSGSLNVNQLNALRFNASTSSGSIRLSNVTIVNDIILQSSSGSINGTNVKGSTLTSQTSSGSHRLVGVEANVISITSSSGSNNVTVTMNRNDIWANFSHRSGSSRFNGNRVSGQVGNPQGRYQISITSNSGSNRLTSS